MSTARHDAPAATRGSRPDVPFDVRIDVVLTWLVVGLYVAAVLAGATASSLGIAHLRVDPDLTPTDRWGPLQPIRSDEYNVFTPIRLSTMATGGAATIALLSEAASIVHRYPLGPFSALAYPDASLAALLGGVLPPAMVFAAFWWLPSFLTLLLMPRWFTQLGAHRGLGWLAGALLVLNPANVWWSFQPVQHIGVTLAGCTALLAGHARWQSGRRRSAVALAVLAGVLIAGLPSAYLPWAIVLGLPVLLATTARVLADRVPWADRLPVLVLAGLVAAVLGLGALWEGREGLTSMLATVYPGQRVATAQAQPLSFLYGAPLLAGLADLQPVDTNQSELSSVPVIAVPLMVAAWLLALVARVWPDADHRAGTRPGWRARLPEAVVGAFALVWLGWCSFDLGDAGASVPLLNRVEPFRAAQVVGALGIVGLCLALSHLPRRGRMLPSAVIALAATWVTATAGLDLRATALPELGLPEITLACAALGAATFWLFWRPRSAAAAALTAALALALVVRAGPLQFGLGDLRGSATADHFLTTAPDDRAEGRVWVTDLPPLASLLTATGTPTLGGLMRSGPALDRWLAIDPDRRFEHAWNRGGGYVAVAVRPGAETVVETNEYDQVFVAIDPCRLAEAMPDVAHMALVEPAEVPCLRPTGSVAWAGHDVVLYDVVR